MTKKAQQDIARKLRALNHAKDILADDLPFWPARNLLVPRAFSRHQNLPAGLLLPASQGWAEPVAWERRKAPHAGIYPL